ncbi:hypothetical protein AAVH_43092, partial [Aphelenchoides avenae]
VCIHHACTIIIVFAHVFDSSQRFHSFFGCNHVGLIVYSGLDFILNRRFVPIMWDLNVNGPFDCF